MDCGVPPNNVEQGDFRRGRCRQLQERDELKQIQEHAFRYLDVNFFAGCSFNIGAVLEANRGTLPGSPKCNRHVDPEKMVSLTDVGYRCWTVPRRGSLEEHYRRPRSDRRCRLHLIERELANHYMTPVYADVALTGVISPEYGQAVSPRLGRQTPLP
jgi:hypothetical protein